MTIKQAASYGSNAVGKILLTVLCAFAALVAATPATAQSQPQGLPPANTQFTVKLKFPHATEDRIPVPFELLNGVLVFRATVNDKLVWAILDNGLDGSLIDATFARDAGISLGPSVPPMRTPSGILSRQLVSNVQINVPGQVAMSAPLSALDLSFLAQATGRPISLAIGKEYFGNLLFLIKMSNHTFQLGPSGAVLNAPTGAAPIALRGVRPKVPVVVNGVQFLLTLDLGYNGRIAMSNEAWKRAGLDKLPSLEGKNAGLDGVVKTVLHAAAPSVEFGTTKFRNMDVSLQPVLPIDGDGMVGLGLLSQFDFALDIKAGKLWLISKAR